MASSEVMAILAVSTSLKDLRERMGPIVVVYNKSGETGKVRGLF
jgi:formate--tetrahydrofolate ligase